MWPGADDRTLDELARVVDINQGGSGLRSAWRALVR
jgi:hypothetical protein